MSWSDEERRDALHLYTEVGTAEAARRSGIPARSIRRWANEADLAAARSLALEEGGRLLAKTHQAMRQEARVLLMEKVVDLLERMDQPHSEWKVVGNSVEKVTYDIATSGDVKNYAASINQLIDKYRLEMGEATARTEEVASGDIDRSVIQLVAELARRGEAQAPPSTMDRTLPTGPATP